MEVRKPFDYKEHVLPLVTNQPSIVQVSTNHPVKPLMLQNARPLTIKGPTRLSNYQFLNELKCIQAEGIAERQKITAQREIRKQQKPVVVPLKQLIEQQIHKLQPTPQLEAQLIPSKESVSEAQIKEMITKLFESHKHELRQETRRLIKTQLIQPESRDRLQDSRMLSETLEQSLRRAVGRHFPCEPLSELDMQVQKCKSLRNRGDGTVMRQKIIEIQEIHNEPPQPVEIDPLRLLTPFGKPLMPQAKFISEQDITEDQEDKVELPISEAALARQQRNLQIQAQLQMRKVTEEEQKERAKCLLQIMDHELNNAQQRATNLETRLNQKNEELQTLLDNFELNQNEIERQRLLKKAELAEIEVARTRELQEVDYQIEDIFVQNKMLYTDVDRHRKKRGQEPLEVNGDEDEESQLTAAQINKLYSQVSKKKEKKSAQRTTEIIAKKKQIKSKIRTLGKQKVTKPAQKPKIVAKSQKEQKRNLRLEAQINESMGATFEFLGGLIERSKKLHEQINK